MATATPSVADFVAALEAGTPMGTERAGADRRALLARNPELAAVEVRDFPVEGPDGVVPARLYLGPAGSEHALVWMHGGAFLAGDLDMPEADWVGLALAAVGISVLSVDYRKALGGIRFPAPSDDVLAAWNTAAARLSVFGPTVTTLHLGGASAGASLAAGLAKRLRDGAGPLPASVVLAYPLVHAELPPMSDELAAAVEGRPEGAIVFGRRWIADLSRHYVGAAGSLEDPYAFPASGDLRGQPPIFILNSEYDTLRASGEAYAQALTAAGVQVTCEFEPGSVHGHLNTPERNESQASIRRMAEWLNKGA